MSEKKKEYEYTTIPGQVINAMRNNKGDASGIQTPPIVRDIGRAGKAAATGVGVIGSGIYDAAAAASEYLTGVKSPRLMGKQVEAFKDSVGINDGRSPIPAPSVIPKGLPPSSLDSPRERMPYDTARGFFKDNTGVGSPSVATTRPQVAPTQANTSAVPWETDNAYKLQQFGHTFGDKDIARGGNFTASAIPKLNTDEFSKWFANEQAVNDRRWSDVEASQNSRDAMDNAARLDTSVRQVANAQTKMTDQMDDGLGWFSGKSAVPERIRGKGRGRGAGGNDISAVPDMSTFERASDNMRTQVAERDKNNIEVQKFLSGLGLSNAQIGYYAAQIGEINKKVSVMPPDYETSAKQKLTEIEAAKEPKEKTEKDMAGTLIKGYNDYTKNYDETMAGKPPMDFKSYADQFKDYFDQGSPRTELTFNPAISERVSKLQEQGIPAEQIARDLAAKGIDPKLYGIQ